MEKRFEILTMDGDGIQHVVAHELTSESVTKMATILIEGEDPNRLVDIVIHPFIKL